MHLLRGVLGAALALGAIALWDTYPIVSVVFAAGMVAAFRGCPMCWTMGLCETIYRRGK
jgi:hypothetical protein